MFVIFDISLTTLYCNSTVVVVVVVVLPVFNTLYLMPENQDLLKPFKLGYVRK